MKFAKCYKDLDRISLFIKLQFVEKHGFVSVIDAFDRRLRNCIAHLRYHLEEDGTLVYDGNRLSTKDLTDKFSRLWGMAMAMHVAFSDAYLVSTKAH